MTGNTSKTTKPGKPRAGRFAFVGVLLVGIGIGLSIGVGMDWARAHFILPHSHSHDHLLENTQTPAQEAAIAELATLGGGTSFGAEDADVTIYEFSDYNCGFCKRAFGEVLRAIEADGKARVVVVEYPILAQSSADAARLALHAAAISPATFAEVHTALMRHRGPVTDGLLRDLADKHGIGDFLAPSDSHSDHDPITQQLMANHRIGRVLSIRGTPSFVIGGEVIVGALDRDDFMHLIKNTRTKQR